MLGLSYRKLIWEWGEKWHTREFLVTFQRLRLISALRKFCMHVRDKLICNIQITAKQAPIIFLT